MKNTDTKVTDLSAEQQKAVIDTKQVLASKQDVLMELGQIRAFDFMSKLATVASLRSLENIKQSKSYKGLTYNDENGGLATVASWEDCCKHLLNTSARSVDDRLINLNAFGDEFFEASQSMGLGYRDLRKLRQLPEDEQALIIDSQAVDTGDKEAVKELIEDLSAKYSKEKTQLKSQLDESQSLANARSNLLQQANSRLNSTTEELAQLKERQNKAPEPEQWAKQVHEVNQLSTRLAAHAIELTGQLDEVSETINTLDINATHSDRALAHMAAVQLHCVDQLFLAINALSMDTRQRFEFFINQSRPMYSEEEILALENDAEARG